MAKPVTLPTIATDANLSSGTESGSTVILEPSSGVKAQGFVPGRTFVARHWNWWANLVYQWISYVNGLASDAQFLGTLWVWTQAHIWSGSFGPGLLSTAAAEVYYCNGAGAAATRTRTILVSPWDIQDQASADVTRLGDATNGHFSRLPASTSTFLDLRKYLPHGSTVTQVRCVTEPDTSGTLEILMVRGTPNFATPGSTGTRTSLDTSSGTSFQLLDSGAISYAVDNAASVLGLEFATGSGTNTEVFGIEITFSDPGPRNY